MVGVTGVISAWIDSVVHVFRRANKMDRSTRWSASLCALKLCLAIGAPAVAAESRPSGNFAAFVDDYYNALFVWDPTQATYAGIHDFDGRMPDLSAASVRQRAEALKKM